MKVLVKNLTSHSGNKVANQFEIEVGDKVYFQSYSTIIAMINKDNIYLDKDAWDYSTTTAKYRNIFLGTDTKTTKQRIKDGRYKLRDLNK